MQGTHGSHADFQAGLAWQFLCWPGCDFDYAKPYLELLAAERGRGTTAALVFTNGRIGEAVATGVRHHGAALGIVLVFDEAIGDEPFDYDDLMQRVSNVGADALLIGLDHGRPDDPRLSCLTAAHAAGIAADPVAADNKSGAANEGVHMRITWVPELSDPHSRQFAADYRSAFGAEAEFHCAGGYACGEVLAQAADVAGAWKAAAIREAILGGTFDTVCGSLRFQENGLPECVLHVGVWQGGRLAVVGE